MELKEKINMICDKKIIFLICLSVFIQAASSEEIPVKLLPAYKISTSNVNLSEGDRVDFIIAEDIFYRGEKILGKGQKVSATITNLEDNDFYAKPASVYIENFVTKDVKGNKVKLKGIIFKKGNEHRLFTDWFYTDVVRGGEVHMLPEKHNFTLYMETTK